MQFYRLIMLLTIPLICHMIPFLFQPNFVFLLPAYISLVLFQGIHFVHPVNKFRIRLRPPDKFYKFSFYFIYIYSYLYSLIYTYLLAFKSYSFILMFSLYDFDEITMKFYRLKIICSIEDIYLFRNCLYELRHLT